MRQLDRARKRAERARLAQVDPDRERRAGQARTAAVRRLIAAYEPEYRALLAAERARREAAHQQEEVAHGARGGLLSGWPHPARPTGPRSPLRTITGRRPVRGRQLAASALGHRRRHHRPRRGRPALAGPAVRRPLRRPAGPARPAVARLATKSRASSARQTLREILDRWEDRGLIARDRLLGHLWVAPTAKALRLVGLDVRAWSFVIPQLAHVHAVGVVRLALEPSIPAGGRWLSGAGAAPRGRQEPRPRRRHPAPRRPRHRGRVGPVRRGRRPAAQAGGGRGRADPQGRRPAAGGLDPAPAWPLDTDRLLRPARGRRLPDRPAPAHPASPSHPGPPAARGARAPATCAPEVPHDPLQPPRDPATAGRPPPASRSPAPPASRPPTACCWSCWCWSGSRRCPSWPGCSGRR